MNRAIVSLTLSAALVLAPLAAQAADNSESTTGQRTTVTTTNAATSGPLAPAGAANIKEAQGDSDHDARILYYAAGGAAIVLLTVWALSNHHHHGGGGSTPSTGTTGTN